MRYEFSEHGWTAIKPMLPNKPRALVGQMAAACSMPSFGSGLRVRHGAICRRPMVSARLVTIASFGE
jgi:hypothetical protein